MIVKGWGREPGRGWRLPVLVGAVVGVLAACGGTEPPVEEPTSVPTSSETPSTTEPTPGPSGTTPSESVAVPVYFVVDTRAGLRLAREQHEITGDPVTAAVEAMIAGAADPDYATTWNAATEVLGVEVGDEVVTVDLSEGARTAGVGSEGAALMIQQLVYTATGAVGTAGTDLPVELTIDGEPAGELWGAVTWDGPVFAADPLDVRMLVQIDEPAEGAGVGSPVTVAGDAAVFEANLAWKVRDGNGSEAASGFTMTAQGQTFAPYSFTVDLEPGTYTVEITEDDPSDGAGGTPMTDTRTITVH